MKLFSEFEAASRQDGSQETGPGLAQIRLNLGAVGAVLGFASARGGVGKSAIAVNVAAALALRGRKVAMLDADLNSPSVAAMLGLKRVKIFPAGDGIDPAAGPLGLRVVASDLLVDSEPPPLSLVDEEPVAARPAANGAGLVELSRAQMLRRLFGQTRLGAIDFLIVDLGPGLAELDAVARVAPLTGAILVSHPTELGVKAARAALDVAAKAQTPILGIIENMTGFFCGNCHSVRPMLPQGDLSALAREKSLTILGRLSFDPRLAETCDHGTQFVREYADSPLAKQIAEIAGRLEEMLAAHARRVPS